MRNIDVCAKAVASTEQSFTWKMTEQGLRAQTVSLLNFLDFSVPSFLVYKMVYFLTPS